MQFKQAYYSIPLIIFLILCAFLWKGMSLEPKKIPSNLLNQPMPNITLKQIDTGQPFYTKDLIGQVTLLHVWASWCPTCLAEHSYLMDIANKDVNLIGLIFRDSAKNVSKMLRALGNPYQYTLMDEEGEATMAFGIYGTPETFIIDKKGIIRYKHVGDINARNWPILMALIDRYNKEDA